MRFRLFPLALAVLLAWGLPAASPAAQTIESLDEAQSLAAQTGRLIVIDFFADWCGPCKRFAKAAEEDPALQAALEKVVLFTTDAEKEGKDLAEQHSIQAYPTYVVLNAQGTVLDRWWGFESAEDWIATLDGVLADPVSVSERTARFDEQPTAKDAEVLARVSHTRGDSPEAIRFYREVQRLDPARADAQVPLIFAALSDGFRGDRFTVEEVKAGADAVLALEQTELRDVFEVAWSMNAIAKKTGDRDLAAPYIVAALARSESTEDPDLLRQRKALLVEHALVVDKDADRAVALRKQTLPEGWDRDANQMNGFAWWCFENRVNLEEAESIARKAVDLAESDQDKANILDTVAEICNARGNCRDAVSLIEQALLLSPDREYLKRQHEKFSKLLAASE